MKIWEEMPRAFRCSGCHHVAKVNKNDIQGIKKEIEMIVF